MNKFYTISNALCVLFCFFGSVSGVVAQPTISSLTIYTGNNGAPVGIRGTNFNTTAANNVVYFGATRATVLSSTATTVNVNVPFGATYQPISVLNTGTNLMCNSQRAFLPSFNSTYYVAGAIHFDAKVDFSTTSSNAYGVVIADIDGDGKPDMIVTNFVGNSICVYRNTSITGTITSSSYGSPVIFATGINPTYLKVADLDADGKLDIIVANAGSGTVSVFKNTAISGIINSSSLAAKVDFVAGSSPFDIAVADFDGDGKPDLAVTNSINTANTISVLRNTSVTGIIGTASFAAPITFGTGSIPVKIIAADFDGDGKPDIAVTNNSSNTISIFRNTAIVGSITTTSFATKVDFATGNNPRGIFAADLDNDGKFDLVVTNRTSNNISIYRNTTTVGAITTASFDAQDTFTASAMPYDVAMGDVDGNGKPDIIVTNFGASSISILRNIGSTGVINASTFTAKNDFVTGGTGGPYGVAVGDLDGDGKPDIVVANSNSSGSVTVLHNNMLLHIANSGMVCIGNTRTLSDSIAGGTWSSSATSIANISSTGVVTGVSAGVAIITYSVTGSSDTAQITVVAIPTIAGITPSATTICIGTPLTLTAGAVTGGGTLTTYNWAGPNSYTATGTTTTAAFSPTTTAASGFYSLTVTYSSGCSSLPAVTTSSVSVIPVPIVGNITGVSSICVGSSATMTNATTGGTWKSSNIALATINGTSGIVNGIAGGVVSISYSVSNACAATVVTKSITINATPTITATTPNSRCLAGTLTLSAIASAGTVNWYAANTGGSSLYTGNSYTTPIISATTTYYASATSAAGCTTSSRIAVIATIKPQPLLTNATNSGQVCLGGTVSLFANGATNVTNYLWAGINTITNSTNATATIANATTVGSSIYTVTVNNGIGMACIATYTTTVVVNVHQAWLLLASSNNWNFANNWACGKVPTATDTILIPAGSNYIPEILTPATGSVFSITIATGAMVTIDAGSTLGIKGGLTNGGSVVGNGYLVFNGTSAQVIKGKGAVSNLQILNSAGISINTTTDTVTVNGTLKLTLGNFNTSNRLVLAMSDNQTLNPANGRIDAISGGSITGMVIDQQYITGGRRAYRFWGTPFVDSIALNQLENYMDITGLYGSVHGFTSTNTNSPSAYWLHTTVSNSSVVHGATNPGWIPFTWCKPTPGLQPSADTNLLTKYEGIRLFFRGAKGEGLDGLPYTPSLVTVRQWGHVNTGDFDMPLQKGFAKNGSAWIQDYNQKSNPYPSAIDIGAVIHNAWADSLLAESKFYVWNPYGGAAGLFITINESTYTPYIIPANSSFQVRARYGHDSSKLHFTESIKSASIATPGLLRLNNVGIALNIYDTSYLLWDMLNLRFNNAATDAQDASFDGGKPMNEDLNFYSLSSDNQALSWDERPYKTGIGMVIPLGLSTNHQQDFIIRVDSFAIPTVGKLYLYDKYKEQYTLLEYLTEYRFAVTNDTASQGDNRFEIDSVCPKTL